MLHAVLLAFSRSNRVTAMIQARDPKDAFRRAKRLFGHEALVHPLPRGKPPQLQSIGGGARMGVRQARERF